jgi:hypothetical protein
MRGLAVERQDASWPVEVEGISERSGARLSCLCSLSEFFSDSEHDIVDFAIHIKSIIFRILSHAPEVAKQVLD